MEINVKSMEPTLNTKNPLEPKTCFGCLYNSRRYCTWFSIHRGEREKHIPLHIFNKGCKLREPSVENQEHDEIVQKILEVFNGEIAE